MRTPPHARSAHALQQQKQWAAHRKHMFTAAHGRAGQAVSRRGLSRQKTHRQCLPTPFSKQVPPEGDQHARGSSARNPSGAAGSRCALLRRCARPTCWSVPAERSVAARAVDGLAARGAPFASGAPAQPWAAGTHCPTLLPHAGPPFMPITCGVAGRAPPHRAGWVRAGPQLRSTHLGISPPLCEETEHNVPDPSDLHNVWPSMMSGAGGFNRNPLPQCRAPGVATRYRQPRPWSGLRRLCLPSLVLAARKWG